MTIAGALVEQNAEALAGIVLTQVVRPGAPVVYGGFTSNVDMQSGAPAFGTPEYMRAAIVGGQLARRYGLPYRSSNVSAANAVDAQAAYESVFALWGAIMGGVNLMMHGAGWMEGGLHAGYEKMILDAELLGMVEAFLDPLPWTRRASAFDAMLEVGPGGHFFGAAAHAVAVPDRLPQADAVGLAQLRVLGGGRQPRGAGQGQQDLEGHARGLRATAHRSRRGRGARGLRRPPQGRGRRPDGLLKPLMRGSP